MTFCYPKITGRLLLCYTILLLTGCITPETKLELQATAYGFTRHQIISNGFLLTVFKNNPICNNNQQHVYIGGDGTPWLHHRMVAFNPTPKHLLTLDLMRFDNASSLYLGRPCYHGQHNAKACTPLYWTHWRYSSTVVNSMVSALLHLLASTPNCKITLIGYSGGGTLAMLMASKLPAIHRVITISGNLNVAAWTRYHHYSQLDGSLDPATEAVLPAKIIQIHLLGDNDSNIPAEIVLPSLMRQPEPFILQFPNIDHDCCWTNIWPEILKQLESKS